MELFVTSSFKLIAFKKNTQRYANEIPNDVFQLQFLVSGEMTLDT